MLTTQKDLFNLDESVTYLNGAYLSPQLKSVTQAGMDELCKKDKPHKIKMGDFFDMRIELKKNFAALIGAENFESIAIVPSASYGISSVANNICLEKGDEILVCEAQFPSHIYAWQEIALKHGGKMVTINAPALKEGRAKLWNENILNAISNKTKVVALPQVHWADGTLFDLMAIRKRATEVGAKLIIDATQSVGASPFSVAEIKPDALICSGYKWLMGAYGMGLAYFSESFWDGIPIEHNWMNRLNSEDFSKLTVYQPKYQPGAERYSVGGSSNFILSAMLSKGIEQLLAWKPGNIQEYCGELMNGAITELRSAGCFIEEQSGRKNHLIGVYVPNSMDKLAVKKRLEDNNVYVSVRGEVIRTSPNLYNTKEDIDLMLSCFFE